MPNQHTKKAAATAAPKVVFSGRKGKETNYIYENETAFHRINKKLTGKEDLSKEGSTLEKPYWTLAKVKELLKSEGYK